MPDCVFILMKRKRSVDGHDCLEHRLLGNVNHTCVYVFGVLDCASDTLCFSWLQVELAGHFQVNCSLWQLLTADWTTGCWADEQQFTEMTQKGAKDNGAEKEKLPSVTRLPCYHWSQVMQKILGCAFVQAVEWELTRPHFVLRKCCLE